MSTATSKAGVHAIQGEQELSPAHLATLRFATRAHDLDPTIKTWEGFLRWLGQLRKPQLMKVALPVAPTKKKTIEGMTGPKLVEKIAQELKPDGFT